MSPFAGSTTDSVWQDLDLRCFLPGERRSSAAPGVASVAFRVAFELPVVSRVAVGTTSAAHLAALVDAVTLPVDDAAVSRYRQLINDEQSEVTSGAG
jgi:pyridoxine 4-dehydrogenase